MTQPPRNGTQSTTPLPAGVALRPLSGEGDCAGRTTELYRNDWQLGIAPVQWNLVSSNANTLRGVHAHIAHSDYLYVVGGAMLLGLHDMRPTSPTYRLPTQLWLCEDAPASIAIPPGVAHGFYFAAPTKYCYAVSHYWDPSDELGCRWDDPALGFCWPTADPLLSERDADAPGYAELTRALAGRLGRSVLPS